MPANTQPTRRSGRTTRTTTDQHAAPATESTSIDGENVVSAEESGASTDAPAMFDNTAVVLPNLFDRNNKFVLPDTK